MAGGSNDEAELRARIAELENELEREREAVRAALSEKDAELLHAQKMEAIGRLASGVAHDFNNLLTAVMGHGALALEGLGEDDPVRADVQEILRAGERGASLTKQLLVFGRRQALRTEPLDLNQVVSGIAKLLKRVIGEDVELDIALAPEGCNIHGDRSQLEQVLMNLAVNARDAMPEGGTLSVTTRRLMLDASSRGRPAALEPGDYVQLEVRDSGTGMDAQVLVHAFEPFFTTKEEKGSGLGLATVYGIVTQSGGAIEVDSAPGRGTCFRIFLPKGRRDSSPPPAERPSGPAASGTETVLLAEDDPAVRSLVRRALAAHGYRVLAAADGVEALELVEGHEGPVDLLLTDIVMPKMRGPELVARLAKRDPDLRVLYISGYPDEWGLLEACLTAEETLLQKPFTTETLLARVREILDSGRECLH